MAQKLYSLLIALVNFLLPIIALFSSKMKQFSSGRKGVLAQLKTKIKDTDHVIWFHAASLGEYEQGVPVMEEVRKLYPTHKILLSFFSPSGYTIKKDTPLADVVVYLPLDTERAAKEFIKLVHPEIALFIKYEFWPNYLNALKKSGAKTVLISGVFRSNQPFFKWSGRWMLKSFEAFDHFFVQNETSYELAKSLGYNNVTVSGDTRFDRVSAQLEQNNKVDFIEEFVDSKPCLVCGSTWPEDEDLLLDFLNNYVANSAVKVIIAPHQINEEKITSFVEKLKVKAVKFSKKEGENLALFPVFILDTVGFLGRVYQYADVAYIGGAAGTTGLHNILEPATFGLPIITGTNISKFPEAVRLRQLAGLYTVNSAEEANDLLVKFFENKDFREKAGMISGHFVQNNTGATRIITKYLQNHTVTA
ncbi:3-deoxy-D-manno-octulosonic acid transferase [Leeuwenhoekiella sp. A16]|uniref:3-deoxy-D-manno-octulosonic acid transferase n=1 Tax=Leeuwenhoekiella sp. A16 TaxID=3141462 RepID=UPI003A801EBE